MSQINPDAFTHLRVYSHYSLLKGVANVRDLAQRAAVSGMTALALTDVNGLYGAVAFTQACREAGVRPIIGMTAPVAPPEGASADYDPPGQLVLLADGPQDTPHSVV